MRTYFLAVLLLSASFFSAQRISNLALYAASGKSVTIKFTITPGATCYGYSIHRSTDSLNFFQIYDYPQQCGGSGAPEEESYTDPNPTPNVVNYYKVQLIPYETSPVARIYVGSNGVSNIIAFPNPVYDHDQKLRVRIFNTNAVRMQGFLVDQFGISVQDLDVTTDGNLVSIDVESLRNGFYVVWLTDGYNLFRAKFIVNR